MQTSNILNKGQQVKVGGQWRVITEVMHDYVSSLWNITFRFGKDDSYMARSKDKIYTLGQIEEIKKEDLPKFSNNNEEADFIKRFIKSA